MIWAHPGGKGAEVAMQMLRDGWTGLRVLGRLGGDAALAILATALALAATGAFGI